MSQAAKKFPAAHVSIAGALAHSFVKAPQRLQNLSFLKHLGTKSVVRELSCVQFLVA